MAGRWYASKMAKSAHLAHKMVCLGAWNANSHVIEKGICGMRAMIKSGFFGRTSLFRLQTCQGCNASRQPVWEVSGLGLDRAYTSAQRTAKSLKLKNCQSP